MAKSFVYILEVCAHVKHIKKKYTFSQDKHPFSEYGTYTRPPRHVVCIHKKLEKYQYLVGGLTTTTTTTMLHCYVENET